MVAYSFKSAFVDDIAALRKRQTIRLPRPRHARPGEDIQIFAGMRTKHCRKIIPDPRCVAVDNLVLDLRPGHLAHLEINGVVLDLDGPEADAFAIADGFSRPLGVRPIEFFGTWWARTHRPALFEDLVIIRWESQP
ncbi:ASCH domain-containing protein [Ancylobacter defluvii]|uniref:ASCH domain-containing protein n=1 Tax=Ancylobacter defluvii TaxID=1282440 RepID=A0A9W6JXJ9_9HYPH|nr:ASCH domain-containing protein [Ancylobacter defluvii]MBS7586430.1 ASCH domain-containing protein [Ancylobacter defluvii]GLK85711.1 hypothetical protein GCM10017653_37810 [Ancylobacter defluvii]